MNLIVEVDGPGHTRPRTRREDARRDARLRAAGHRIVRIPDYEIDHPPKTVASSLLSAAELCLITPPAAIRHAAAESMI